jgi:hypothetical protein
MMNDAIDWSPGVHDCLPSKVTFERLFPLGQRQNIFGLQISLFTSVTKKAYRIFRILCSRLVVLQTVTTVPVVL